ncbi:MAG TPA: nitronate monooxygenase [Thermoanaerobaculia bacterium]|jgi:enoyl-[acyl-carrier protein] reductase II|nr:nitronate monooxygenase [Thermoanaerobaculia bacterium]
MSHDDPQNPLSSLTVSRRQALGFLGGISAITLLGVNPSRAGQDDREEQHEDHEVSLHTRLVHDYGIRHPIVSAGMAFVGLPDLAVAVSNAGGLGVYGAAPEPPPVVDARLSEIASRTSHPYGVDFILATGPMGDFTTQDHIDIAAGHRVPVVVFHFNLPPQSWVDQLQAAGSRVWVQAGSVEMADRAARLGCDAIVVQGKSAGGHNRNLTIPTLALLAQVRKRVPHRILLLAAGGIADGRSLVKALRAGADGGWVGTRFAASTESYAQPGYKARLVNAKGKHATTFTTVFGPEFPNATQRVLANRAATKPASTEPPVIGSTLLFPGAFNVPYDMPKYSAIVPTRDTTGDFEEMDMPAGSESELETVRVQPAAEILEEIVADARRLLAHGSRDDD